MVLVDLRGRGPSLGPLNHDSNMVLMGLRGRGPQLDPLNHDLKYNINGFKGEGALTCTPLCQETSVYETFPSLGRFKYLDRLPTMN